MKKGKNDGERIQHIRLAYELLNSAAWTALDSLAHDLYIELKKKWKDDEGGDDHLVLIPSEVSWLMSTNTYWNKIRDLIDYGLIKIVEHGGFPKKPSVYALSERWRKKSIDIVDKEGREAIRAGYVRKRRHRDVSTNAAEYWAERRKESNAGIKH